MLNVIKSIIVTFITVIVSILSYLKGPIAIGLLVGASILAFANDAQASTIQGTQAEVIQVAQDVARGVYINDVGVSVDKPDTYICNMYRNTYLHYANKYGPSKGARIWLVIVTRRGC